MSRIPTATRTVDNLFAAVGLRTPPTKILKPGALFSYQAGWSFEHYARDRVNDQSDPNTGTFFQMLPSPRQYARFPFFNLMNNADGFVELMLRPARVLTIRTDVHALRLANGNDLWYQGGGVYQPATFGYVGQPVNGNRRLATLLDASADVTVTRGSTVTGYCYAAGGSASSAPYPTSNHAAFGYLELLGRF